jgi:acyl-CoA thioester hydrolase
LTAARLVRTLCAMSAPPLVLTPADFRFSCPLELRFRDLDAMGHVNNAVYVTYFEMTRTAYLRALGGDTEPGRSLFERYPFVVGEITCRYLSPVVLSDRLRAYGRVSRFGTKSFDFDYLLVREPTGEVVTTGLSRQICFDYAAGRSMPVPAALRELILSFEQRSPAPGS